MCSSVCESTCCLHLLTLQVHLWRMGMERQRQMGWTYRWKCIVRVFVHAHPCAADLTHLSCLSWGVTCCVGMLFLCSFIIARSQESGKPCGFVNFRFDLDDGVAVAYWWVVSGSSMRALCWCHERRTPRAASGYPHGDVHMSLGQVSDFMSVSWQQSCAAISNHSMCGHTLFVHTAHDAFC